MAQTNSTHDHQAVDRLLWIYVSPFIFIFGIIGNVFIVIIFMCTAKPKMKGTSTALYLIVMGISDIGFLIFGLLPEWLEKTGIVVTNGLHPWVCKWEKFLFYTTGDVAIWITCAFTIDRAGAVTSPIKKRPFCTRKGSGIAALVTVLLAVIKNAHVFWTRGVEHKMAADLSHEPLFSLDNVVSPDNVSDLAVGAARDVYAFNRTVIDLCGRPEPYAHFEYYIRPLLAFITINVVPVFIICVCNVIIVKSIAVAEKRRHVWMTCHDKTLRHTLPLCLSASFAFIICVTPSMILYIGKPYWEDHPDHHQVYDVAKAISNQLAYLNHSINFFLYCLTGQASREEFRYLFTKKRHDARRESYAYNAVVNLVKRKYSQGIPMHHVPEGMLSQLTYPRGSNATPLSLSQSTLNAILDHNTSNPAPSKRCCKWRLLGKPHSNDFEVH